MQSLIQIADRNATRLAFADFRVECRCGEIEICRPFEGEPSFPNVALVLGGVVSNRHSFIVYAIYLEFLFWFAKSDALVSLETNRASIACGFISRPIQS
jgi:hypothetical protein